MNFQIIEPPPAFCCFQQFQRTANLQDRDEIACVKCGGQFKRGKDQVWRPANQQKGNHGE